MPRGLVWFAEEQDGSRPRSRTRCPISHRRRRGLDLIPILQIRKLRQKGCPRPPCPGPKAAHTTYISRLDSGFRLGSPSPQLLSDRSELTSMDSDGRCYLAMSYPHGSCPEALQAFYELSLANHHRWPIATGNYFIDTLIRRGPPPRLELGSPVSKARCAELKINQAQHWPEAQWVPLAQGLHHDSLRVGAEQEGMTD